MKILILMIITLMVVGCSKKSPQQPITIRDIVEAESADLEEKVPGTVDYTWEEQMIDTINVPAQLDPTGTYYRPAHRTIVEIYEGRVQPVEYPNED